MISEMIMNLLECEHDPNEREKVYRKIERSGIDRKTADLMASEYRKCWLSDQEKAKKEIEEKERQEELLTALLKKADELGWLVHRSEDGIDFEQGSPAGEDFIFHAELPDLVKSVCDYYNNFDPEEHAEMWAKARLNGARDVPRLSVLVKDADAIDEMLKDLSEALDAVDQEVRSQW